jgi:glycosyltransferase involved in cell wall biosynthesis
MRIAFVSNEYPPEPHGGIGSFLSTHAPALAAEGHDVTVVGVGDLASERREGDVRVVRIPRDRRRGIAWLSNRWRLKAWLERQKPPFDLVEVPDFEGWMPFAIDGPAVVVRLHLAATTIARHGGMRVRPLLRWCERRTLAVHRAWIAVSDHAQRLTTETFQLEPLRTVTIYCPVPRKGADTVSDSEPPQGPFVLFAGTVSERKGALVVAEAARGVLAGRPALQLVFAGPETSHDGTSIGDVIRGIVGEALSNRVTFTGRLPRGVVRHLMSKAAMLAFPSTLETFGLVVAEAMLEGCPPVVTNQAPFDEFVSDGETGLTVPPRDPEAMAAAMTRLLDDEAMRARLGRQAQQKAEQCFSVERAVRNSVAFYSELLASQRAR